MSSSLDRLKALALVLREFIKGGSYDVLTGQFSRIKRSCDQSLLSDLRLLSPAESPKSVLGP
jgi:hypothetical protein